MINLIVRVGMVDSVGDFLPGRNVDVQFLFLYLGVEHLPAKVLCDVDEWIIFMKALEDVSRANEDARVEEVGVKGDVAGHSFFKLDVVQLRSGYLDLRFRTKFINLNQLVGIINGIYVAFLLVEPLNFVHNHQKDVEFVFFLVLNVFLKRVLQVNIRNYVSVNENEVLLDHFMSVKLS